MFNSCQDIQKSNLSNNIKINYYHVIELVHPNEEERNLAHQKISQLSETEPIDLYVAKLRKQFNDNLNVDSYPLSDEVWFSISDSEDEEERKRNYLLMQNFNKDNKDILITYLTYIKEKYGNYSEYQANMLFGNDGYQYITKILGQIQPIIISNIKQIYKDFDDNQKKDWNRRYLTKKINVNKQNNMNSGELDIDDALNSMIKIWEKIHGITTSYNKIYLYDEDNVVYQFTINKNNKPMGVIYGDFFVRPGKYHRGLSTDIVLRTEQNNGISYVITSFASSTLKFDNIVTLFHEMGHGLHKCLTLIELTPYNSLLSEVPSTVNENLIFGDMFFQLTKLKFTRNKINYNQLAGDLINSYISLGIFSDPHYIDNNQSNKIYEDILGFSLDNNKIYPEFNMVQLFTMGSTYYKYILNDIDARGWMNHLDNFIEAIEKNEFKLNEIDVNNYFEL
jgi:hypothetical protein